MSLSADAPLITVQEGMAQVRAIERRHTFNEHLVEVAWFIEGVDYEIGEVGKLPAIFPTSRSRLQTALTTLKDKGLCGFNRHYVWPVLK